jgi:N-acetylglucosaminyldiphosphoundecaprenol N-acetyl-beta-D-mannosaminyltransferase
MLPKKLLEFEISYGRYADFLLEIISAAKKHVSFYVCIANVHMFIEAYRDKLFLDVIKKADIVTPDGMPLVLALRFLKGVIQDRVAGMDLLPDLLKIAENENIGIFFYGGTDLMLEKTKKYLAEMYPKLMVHGYISPPFRILTDSETEEIITNINNSGAGLVFVVLGCPKQEKWMYSMKGKINSCMIGIGGALPVLVGMNKRAPMWMQKRSLEWFYRLLQEPRRLFKRYLITNSIFVFIILKEYFKMKAKRHFYKLFKK